MPEKPENIEAILAEMRDFAKPLRVGGDLCSNIACPATISVWADRIEAAVKSQLEDIRNLCQAEIDSYLSDHISAIFMLKVVRECADDQLRRLAQGKGADNA